MFTNVVIGIYSVLVRDSRYVRRHVWTERNLRIGGFN